MTQVQLDRHPFAKHTFYKGVYTHNNTDYSFDLVVEESVNSIRPAILVEFKAEYKLRPFDYSKACKEILAMYLPDGNQETKD
jgi:hypothetical protein